MIHPVPFFPNNMYTPTTPNLHLQPYLSYELQSLVSNCLLSISTWMSNRHLKFHVPQINPFVKHFSQPTSPPVFPLLANHNSIPACAQTKNLENKPWLQSLSSSTSSSSFLLLSPPPTYIQSINRFCWLDLQNISRMWALPTISTAAVFISYLDHHTKLLTGLEALTLSL